MKYQVELSGEDVLLILRWLETSGQTLLAVKIRDQYHRQQRAFLSGLSEKARQQETEKETRTKQCFDDFFRGLFGGRHE